MGIIMMVFMMVNLYKSDVIFFWVQFFCVLVMGFGIFIGGWKIIKIVGGKIMKICLVNGVFVDLIGAVIIFGVMFIYFFVSMIYVILFFIFGVGVFYCVKGVNWGMVKWMFIIWVIILLILGIFGVIVFFILDFFF